MTSNRLQETNRHALAFDSALACREVHVKLEKMIQGVVWVHRKLEAVARIDSALANREVRVE
jgi:hypothetical protein